MGNTTSLQTTMRAGAKLGASALLMLAIGACAAANSARSFDAGVRVHTFRKDYANVHVVSQGDHFFMVDAGLQANAPELAKDLRAAGFDPVRLRAIVLTHGHADHAGGASYFRKMFGTPVVAGAMDAVLLAAGKNDRLCPTDNSAKKRLAADQAATFTPLTPDILVDTTLDLLPLTGVPARVVTLAGHTQGSLVVVLAQAALVGDLFRGSIVGSSAEVHFYMCDLQDNRRDVNALLSTIAPDQITFFTGHFGPVMRGAVKQRFLLPL